MKSIAVLYLIIVKILSATPIIKNSTTTPSSEISCYGMCHLQLSLDSYYSYLGKGNVVAVHDGGCNVKNSPTTKIDVNKQSCAMSACLETSYNTGRPQKQKEKTVIISYYAINKDKCHYPDKNLNDDIVCTLSSCATTHAFCCENDFCNTAKNFGLQVLALYTSPEDNKYFPNSYSKRTHKTCSVQSKGKNTKFQGCVFVSHYNISHGRPYIKGTTVPPTTENTTIIPTTENTTITDSNITTTSKNTDVNINYSEYLLASISLLYYYCL